jgi:hypothetical protein
MAQLDTLNDQFGLDRAIEVVTRFRGVCGTWRGPVAKRVKAELEAMLTLHEISNWPTTEISAG